MTRRKLTDVPCPCSIQKQKRQAQGLHGSAPGSLHVCYGCRLGVFVGPLKVGVGVSLTGLPAAGTLPHVGLPYSASI